MASLAHFRVVARLDSVSRTPGTVTIDRQLGLFTVRPYRRRKTYELPLSTVADMVVYRVVLAERKEAKAARKGRR